MTCYILDGQTPAFCGDTIKWAKWFESADRIVKQTERDGVKVSTVFLGLDYSFGEGPPLFFETMIFGGEHDQDQWRYTTWGEAEEGHKEACKIAYKEVIK